VPCGFHSAGEANQSFRLADSLLLSQPQLRLIRFFSRPNRASRTLIQALALEIFSSAVVVAVPVHFEVPTQRASDAVVAFSQQAKAEVLFPADELRQVQSASVSGDYEPEQALTRILGDTGFYARRSTQGKFVVTRATEPTGSLKGKLLSPDGSPAVGVRVVVIPTQQSTLTAETGEFDFASLAPGSYRLSIEGAGYRTIEVVGVKIEANRGRALEAQTLQANDELILLAPQVVEGKFHRRWKSGDSEDYRPQRATGNLDLPRSVDDALPFTMYDREQISRSGVVNLNEFLQRNVLDGNAAARPPEQGGSAGQGNEALYSTGSSNLNLRGYGADETIILVNGRRLPEIVTSGRDAAPPPPDVNFIPLTLVERVEVLPVSASALYSGNPVGGVINIVLRPDVNATEVTTTYTNATGGFDAPQSTVSLQHGESLLGGKLRVRINATFTKTIPVTESELGYIAADTAVGTPPPSEKLYRATPNVRSLDGSALVDGQSFTSVAPGANGTGGLAAFAGRGGVANLALYDMPSGINNSIDSVDYAYGRRQSGSSFFGSVTQEVFPWLEVGVDGIYTHTVVNRGLNVFTGNLTLDGASPLNPFHEDVAVSLNETAPRLGQTYGEARIDFYSAVLGVLVKLPGDWRVSFDAQYGHSLTQYRGVSGVDAERWQGLVNEGIYNPLRDTQVSAPPPEFYEKALVYYGAKGKFVTLGNYDTLDAAMRVTNRSLLLPTGTGAVTVGGDYRSTHLAPYDDLRTLGNGTTVVSESHWSGRTLERISAFGELQAPLLPSRWLPRWVREVETDLAARYVVSATAQESNMAPTAGLKVDLLGGLSLRASIATSNRMPSPFLSRRVVIPGAIDGGGEVVRVQISDPLRNETYGVTASDALNTNLRPEAAVTRTVGAIFQRGQVHQFRASVDFADTQKSLELLYLEPQAVMGLESLFPGRVTRAPLAPRDTHAAGFVTSLLTGRVNLAKRHSQNVSTSVDYSWTQCFGGRLDVYGRWVYFQRYDLQLLPSLPTIDELDNPDGLAPALLRNRTNFGASWSNRYYGFGLDGHFFDARKLPVDDWATQHNRQINPYWQFDAFVQSDLAHWLPWKVTRFGLRGQLRVNNVLNARPPRYARDPSGAGVQPYGDWRQQTYAISLQATF
jgi:iron complex outermembrane receptor protein